MSERIERIKSSLEAIDNKDVGIYFFVMDTKGHAVASVAQAYEYVKILNEEGYKASILHEKNDYMNVSTWLDQEYAALPHVSIESKELKVRPQDFIIVPEAFSSIAKQTKNMPGKRIISVNSYDYIFESLEPGETWDQFGVTDCYTTNEKSKQHIETVMRNVKVRTIPVGIPEYFKPSDKPQTPTIAVHCRDPRDTKKIVMTFLSKYPQFQWVAFRDMKGMPREVFSKVLSECCMSVWVDNIGGLGTFPIESMKCGVPVIGKIPNMVPQWMEDAEKGMWTYEYNTIPDIMASYLNKWLEDDVPSEILETTKTVEGKFSMEDEKTGVISLFNDYVSERREELTALLEKEEGNELETASVE